MQPQAVIEDDTNGIVSIEHDNGANLHENGLTSRTALSAIDTNIPNELRKSALPRQLPPNSSPRKLWNALTEAVDKAHRLAEIADMTLAMSRCYEDENGRLRNQLGEKSKPKPKREYFKMSDPDDRVYTHQDHIDKLKAEEETKAEEKRKKQEKAKEKARKRAEKLANGTAAPKTKKATGSGKKKGGGKKTKKTKSIDIWEDDEDGGEGVLGLIAGDDEEYRGDAPVPSTLRRSTRQKEARTTPNAPSVSKDLPGVVEGGEIHQGTCPNASSSQTAAGPVIHQKSRPRNVQRRKQPQIQPKTVSSTVPEEYTSGESGEEECEPVEPALVRARRLGGNGTNKPSFRRPKNVSRAVDMDDDAWFLHHRVAGQKSNV
jgi:hypothetical protein